MTQNDFNKGEIIIYTTKDGPKLEVRLEEDTVWLTQKQMALLFNKGIPTINEHIKNIFKEGELDENTVIRKFRITASDGKTYENNFYNLDVIISVGYRVKSTQGTQFRIWATKRLKEYLIKGYSINQKQLQQTQTNLKELIETISLLQNQTSNQLLAGQEQKVLNLLSEYAQTLSTLEQYDKEKLTLLQNTKDTFVLKYTEATKIIEELKKELIKKNEASEFFGKENSNQFKAILANLYQTFDQQELYSSLEVKAAHLLYFIIKDHPFVDGNKRIASFLFVYFLDKNNFLYRKNGEKKIDSNTLTTLALLIAISDPKDKEKFIKIVTNLVTI